MTSFTPDIIIGYQYLAQFIKTGKSVYIIDKPSNDIILGTFPSDIPSSYLNVGLSSKSNVNDLGDVTLIIPFLIPETVVGTVDFYFNQIDPVTNRSALPPLDTAGSKLLFMGIIQQGPLIYTLFQSPTTGLIYKTFGSNSTPIPGQEITIISIVLSGSRAQIIYELDGVDYVDSIAIIYVPTTQKTENKEQVIFSSGGEEIKKVEKRKRTRNKKFIMVRKRTWINIVEEVLNKDEFNIFISVVSRLSH